MKPLRADLALATVQAYTDGGELEPIDVGVPCLVFQGEEYCRRHDMFDCIFEHPANLEPPMATSRVIWQGDPVPRTRLGFQLGQAQLVRVWKIMRRHWSAVALEVDWSVLTQQAPE